MSPAKLSDNVYDKIKARLYQRVGKELRLAYRVLDLAENKVIFYKNLEKIYE